MPLIGSTRKQSTFDLNNNIKIGVAFPLDETNMFKGTKTLSAQIKSNLINLLLTQPGERVNQPNFGVGLKNLLFEQNINQDLLNETAQGDTNLNKNQSPVSLEESFNQPSAPMDTTGMPPVVADAVTRDYSSLMKAIDKKKNNRP